MNRAVVITGAGGLVGAELTAALLPRFDIVLSLSRGEPDLPRLRAAVAAARPSAAGDPAPDGSDPLDRLRALPVSGLTPQALAALGVGEVAQVWNVAAELSYENALLQATMEANAAAPLRLLDLCRPTEGFFQFSTVGVTGPGRRGLRRTVPEEPLWEVDAVNPYVASKLLAEHLLTSRGEWTGIRTSCLRIGSVLGPRHRAPARRNRAGYFALAEMAARALRGGRPLSLDIDPDATPPLVHVEELAAACAALSDRAAAGGSLGAYYHLGDQSLSNRDAITAVNTELGSETLRIGPHTTPLDRAHATVNGDNLAFMDCGFRFDRTVLESQLPPTALPGVDAASFAGFMGREIRAVGARTLRRAA